MLDWLLRNLIRQGRLDVIDPGGRRHVFGDISLDGPVLMVSSWATWARLSIHPQLAFGEAYMDGRLTVANGSIADVLRVISQNLGTGHGGAWLQAMSSLRRLLRPLQQFNPKGRARRNAAHHYDLTGELYALFLDPDLQYSCAYFQSPGLSLEAAQAAKKRHVAAKLNLTRPGLSTLDIGSGWGGLGLELARAYGCEVTGVTLSKEQLAVAQARAAREGLASQARFRLEDYRTIKGRFDRIVSIGMFEHVGVRHYPAFFRKTHSLLADDGVMLLHSIGRCDGPGVTNPWVAKYIFPGGYTPALSEVLPAIERVGLIVTDLEILRLHYAETLSLWRERFVANWDKAAALFDERFCRMWEFYLAGAEMAFRHQGLMVFQIQLAKRVDALPLTRDYMFERERETESLSVRGRAA